MVPIWLALVAFGAGIVTGFFVCAVVCHCRAAREFREHEAEIKRRGAELRERIANGCRQRIPPQGGSGTAPAKRTEAA